MLAAGVIYLMTCVCSAFYVGKTIREPRQRIGGHLYYSSNGKLTTVGCHVGLYHRFNPEVVQFMVLETNPGGSQRWQLGCYRSTVGDPVD